MTEKEKDLSTLYKSYGAVISECGLYRYRLWRIWDDSKPLCMFVMHNPSTADAQEDDPTIRRCVGFAKSWGYGGIYIGNLSPYRATKPTEMLKVDLSTLCPIENIMHTNEMSRLCSMHIFAYGNPIIKDLLPEIWDDRWHYLKLTKSRNPYHPLYLKSDLKPIPLPCPKYIQK